MQQLAEGRYEKQNFFGVIFRKWTIIPLLDIFTNFKFFAISIGQDISILHYHKVHLKYTFEKYKIFLAVHRQLNGWPCHLLTHSLTDH